MLGNIGQWVQDVMGSLGYVGLALLLVLENLLPPIPSEVVLPDEPCRGARSLPRPLSSAVAAGVSGHRR